MHPALQLVEDFLTDRGELALPEGPRMVFVVRGSVTIGASSFGKGEAWQGEGAMTARAGETGAILWRWELSFGGETAPLATGRGLLSREKLTARLETLPEGDLLWRGDSVAFPPGGVAYLHRHQGPGIRVVADGDIRVETGGHTGSYGIGEAWFEAGPVPVFAQAGDRPTRFIRVMILPRALIGKSSIQYVNEDDKAKPKSQQYRVFVDVPLTRP
jgi:hypothetical protein